MLRDTAARCGYDIVFFPSSRAAEGNVGDCTILYGHPSQRVIAGARNLKWYASCWAGVDHFCRDDLYQNPDCLLTNASGAYGTTIAEHSVMVSLMLLRRQMEYTEIIREGDWRVLPGGIHSLHGARVTCLGTGDIGTEFARTAACGSSAAQGQEPPAHAARRGQHDARLHLRAQRAALLRKSGKLRRGPPDASPRRPQKGLLNRVAFRRFAVGAAHKKAAI